MEDAVLFNKYEFLCAEATRGAEEKLLICRKLKAAPDLVRKNVAREVEKVCKEISRQCLGLGDSSTRKRLSYFSQVLGCSDFTQGCTATTEMMGGGKKGGVDINVLVEALDTLAKKQVPIPSQLKYAIKAYVEAERISQDLNEATNLVKLEFKKFYEAPMECADQPEEPAILNSCTAARDTKFQWDALKALSWQNEYSVTRTATRKILERWDMESIQSSE